MIKNKVFINGVDISTFGAMLIKGSYEALLTPPPVKSHITNSSRLEHGERFIPTTPLYDKREVTLQFFVEGATKDEYLTNYKRFMAAITNQQITLGVVSLNTNYKLVYSSCGSYGNYGEKKSKFVAKFTEYNPADRSVISEGSGNLLV